MALRSFNTNGETKFTRWKEARANVALGVRMEYGSEIEGGLPELLTLEGATKLQTQQRQNKSESLLCEVAHMLHCPGPKQFQCPSPSRQALPTQPHWINLCCGPV